MLLLPPPACSIEECAYIFWTGAVAVKNLGETVEPFAIHKSPTFAGGGGREGCPSKVAQVGTEGGARPTSAALYLGRPSPAEHYLDLPLGGVDDMAVWAGRMWRR